MPEPVQIDFTGNDSSLNAAAQRANAELSKLSGNLKTTQANQEQYNKSASEGVKQTNSMAGSWTELNSVIMVGQTAVQAFKKVYNFAKEGAQLDYMQQKFGRLSESIGTTSDAMMGDLRTATKGTMSDMELMASVTDLVGLGLVKTEKDAVRLSTVVAGLGMDMNQLVLTLANQTTMRFDQLGVSVAGFDEKVTALKKSGMDANSAFTEAFLQQAEMQLKKVGNAADTTAGQFAQLEASFKNVEDSAKMTAAVMVGPVVKGLNDTRTEAQRANEALVSLGRAPILSRAQWNIAGKGALELANNLDKLAQQSAVSEARDQWQEATKAVQAYATASISVEESNKRMTASNKDFLSTVMDVSSAEQKYRDGIAAADAALKAHKMTVKEHDQAVQELQATYDQATNKIIADLVLMKYTADGTFDDGEMSAYISTLEKLGLITGDAAVKAREYLGTASNLADTQKRLADESANAAVQGQLLGLEYYRTGQRAKDAIPSVNGIKTAVKNVGEASNDARGPLHEVVKDLSGVPDNFSRTYSFNIIVHGSISASELKAITTGSNGTVSGTCFAAGTPVTMADGTTKPIEQVRVGDTVLSLDLTTHRHITAIVTETFEHDPAEVGELLNVNGLHVTAEHLLWIGDRWRPAGDLWLGAPLLNANSDAVIVTSIERISPSGPVYNIHTNHESHDYFAGGVLVHNAKTTSNAYGGPLNPSGYTIVGDSPSGWSPYAEVVTPEGTVIPHAQAEAMRASGELYGATNRYIPSSDSQGTNNSSTPASQAYWAGKSKKSSSSSTTIVKKKKNGPVDAADVMSLTGAAIAQNSDAIIQATNAGSNMSAMEQRKGNSYLASIADKLDQLIAKTQSGPDVVRANRALMSRSSG